MRALSTVFDVAQRTPNKRIPVYKVEVASFGHPEAIDPTELKWSDSFWERLTRVDDPTTYGVNHAVAIPADGSVCRVMAKSSRVYFQRITSPSAEDDWQAAWTNLGTITATTRVAIAAYGTEVVIFADDGVNLFRITSTNSGASWGSWVSMENARPGEQGIAAAFSADGSKLGVVHASNFNDPSSLYIQIRTGSTWSTGLGQIYGDFEISGLALYYNSDWNIIATMLDGSNVRIARGVYGDGGSYTAGTWSGWEWLSAAKAKVSFTAAVKLRQFHTQGRGKSQPTWYERMSSVMQMSVADTLGVDDPFLTYNSTFGAIYSFAKTNSPWFYSLRTGTPFASMDWDRAWPLDTYAPQGLAIACDGTYIYATSPNQVWRSPFAGGWTPPTPGAGAGTDYALPIADIIAIKETVRPFTTSKLDVLLSNAASAYDVTGSGDATAVGQLRRGCQVTLSIGYHADADMLSTTGKYYVESLERSRIPGASYLAIHAIDAWGLLEHYTFNRPIEWNAVASSHTVYDIIGLILQAVGGTLTYKSRSAYVTAIYPHIDVSTGENGARVLSQLLDLVPDVIFFVGLTGYLVNPQAADAPVYSMRFPA